MELALGDADQAGGLTRDDLLASYSSKGPTLLDHVVKPDLVAPGNGIVSALPAVSATLAAAYPSTLVPASYYMTSVSAGGVKYSISDSTPV